MKKLHHLFKMIIDFLSSRANLTIFQCIMYGIVGYVMGQYLTWPKLILMLIVMYGIQFITRIKAVADGMLFHHLNVQHGVEANEILQRIKKDAEKNNNIN